MIPDRYILAEPITHVRVVNRFGRADVVPYDLYVAAPAVYVEATHATLMTRRDMIAERARARAAARRRRG